MRILRSIGQTVWSNDFLPAYHQGTRVLPGPEPISNLKRPPARTDLQDLELGLAGEDMHRRVGQYMAEKKIDLLVGVRGLAQQMVESASESGMRAEFMATPEEAGDWLARETRDGDLVLLKASRGVKLERALEVWKSHRAIVSGGRRR